MASYVTVTLDTTGPTSPSVSIDQGLYCNAQIIDLTLSASGGDVSQMKIWGDIDLAYDANIQDTEGNSTWISFAASKQVKVSTGEGSKTVYAKFRDDVYNESSQTNDSITYDPSLPTVSVQSGPSPSKISKIATKREVSFQWQSDVIFDEYVIMVVSSSSDPKSSGTQVGTGNGSTNVSGSAGSYPATTNITTTIDGADLEAAGAEGANIIKAFVREHAEDDVWSA
jgi:hypothetical protein